MEVTTLPCPFCGEMPIITKHFKEEMWRLIHRCSVIGGITLDWQDSPASLLRVWNRRHLAGETRTALSYDEACRLARVFNEGAHLGLAQDAKINEWLKKLIQRKVK